MSTTTSLLEAVEEVDLPDARLRERAFRVAKGLADAPGRSFPAAFPEAAGLEGLYRFLNNDRVDLDSLLSPHLDATVDRCHRCGLVLVVHDSTQFKFPGFDPIEGLGPADANGRGFLAHFAVAVRPGEDRHLIGLLGVEPIIRGEFKHTEANAKARYFAKDKESYRWTRMMDSTRGRLGTGNSVHVMDREADWYDLLALMVCAKERFVVRLCAPRVVELESGGRVPVAEALWATRARVRRTVPVAKREHRKSPPVNEARHPSRSARVAKLESAARQVTFRRPRAAPQVLPDAITVNVIHVREPRPPTGSKAIEWLLVTTEPIGTVQEIEQVVDYYRSRWTIEEYFKALKTGCAYEKRQLGSVHALLNALGVLAPMACSLLHLRTAARTAKRHPHVLTPLQMRVLSAKLRTRFHERTATRVVALGVARLGGWISRTTEPPGWQVLGRGYEQLLLLEQGWLLSKGEAL